MFVHPWIDYVNQNVYSQSFVMWHRNGIVFAFSLNYELLLQMYTLLRSLSTASTVKTGAPEYAFHSQQKHNSTPTPPHPMSNPSSSRSKNFNNTLMFSLSSLLQKTGHWNTSTDYFVPTTPTPPLFSFFFLIKRDCNMSFFSQKEFH